ncbi:MAG: hypothetical protein JWQ48_3986 [Conexibacter sp.]|nr:hypothetical protein [Conexibacter sp.]
MRMRTRGAQRLTGLAGIAALTAVAITGCGSSSSSSGGSKSYSIAAVVADAADPYYVSMQCGAEQEAKRSGAKLNWQGPAAVDTAKEVSALNTVSITKPDGIMISPFSPTAFVAPVQRIMKAGTPVTLADGELSQKVAYRTFHADINAAGAALAQRMASALGAHGTLGIVAQDPGDPLDGNRYAALIKVLEAKYPGITVLPVQYANVSTARSASIAAGLLRAHPELNVLYATNGPQAAGVASAIAAAKRQGSVKLFAFDATPQEVSQLKSGAIDTLVAQSPFLEGQQGVRALVSYLKQGTSGPVPAATEAYVPTPFKVLTKDNVEAPASKPFLYLSSCS